MPPPEYIGRDADIMTIAHDLVAHGHQARPTLRNKQADLIAVGPKILNDPNKPADGALKLAGGRAS